MTHADIMLIFGICSSLPSDVVERVLQMPYQLLALARWTPLCQRQREDNTAILSSTLAKTAPPTLHRLYRGGFEFLVPTKMTCARMQVCNLSSMKQIL